MNNTRFATAIHIMTLLADYPGEWLSSDFIAGSISINPVIVRKEVSVLCRKGLVTSRKGKEGGSMLARPSEKISLCDIYIAVKKSDILGKKNLNPNPLCQIGGQINCQLEELYQQTDQVLQGFLLKRTLADFCKQFG